MMRSEIESQAQNLSKIARQLGTSSIPFKIHRRTVFSGSGDSWACAMFAEGLSKGAARAEDPFELLTNLGTSKLDHIVMISASGRTHANLELARKARRARLRTTAVTSSPKSPLVKLCSDSIILNCERLPGLTVGTISFTASLLACTKLVGLPMQPLNLEQTSVAESWARRVKLNKKGKCLFVGSGTDHALAEYGACKIQEVLGYTAFSAVPEQVGHAILFALDASRDSIVCLDTIGSAKMTELYSRLSHAKFRVHKLVTRKKETLSRSLDASIRLQYLALLNAERMRQRDCAFLKDHSRLELSDRLIY